MFIPFRWVQNSSIFFVGVQFGSLIIRAQTVQLPTATLHPRVEMISSVGWNRPLMRLFWFKLCSNGSRRGWNRRFEFTVNQFSTLPSVRWLVRFLKYIREMSVLNNVNFQSLEVLLSYVFMDSSYGWSKAKPTGGRCFNLILSFYLTRWLTIRI